MEKDLHSNIEDRVALATVLIGANTTTNGVTIDTRGYEALEFVLKSGSLTDGTFTTLLEESDNANFSNSVVLPDSDRLGVLPVFSSSEPATAKRVGSIGKKRYQRLSVVTTGVTTGGTFTALAVLAFPRTAPIS